MTLHRPGGLSASGGAPVSGASPSPASAQETRNAGAAGPGVLDTQPGRGAGGAASGAVRKGWFTALLRRVHFFAGILVGPFILVAAVSGGLYALTPTIEKMVYSHELTATSTLVGMPLADQIEAAEAYVGSGASPVAVRPAPGATTRVMFTDETLPESTTRAIFVDPATAEIRGDLPVYGTSGALPVRHWISDLHRSLHLGAPGRWYSELAASWLGIVALAGLGLWIGRFVRSRRGRRDLLRPNRSHRGYRRLSGWHSAVGIWVVLGAIFLSATGITWSTFAGANVTDLRAAIGGGTPALDTSLHGAADAGGDHAEHLGAMPTAPTAANPATFDAVLATAKGVNVNSGDVEIRPPSAPGTAWVVQEIHRSFPTEVDAVAIDGTTMQVVDRVDFTDFPLLAKLSRWGIDLHMGTMFGLANQIALFVLAVGIAALVVLGYAMWWKRRPTRGFGAAPARGALRGAPWWGVGAVLIGAVLIGLVLPLVGYPLAAFVVLDVLLGWRARRAGLRSSDG
ncbi:PepSY-associated TM helix domain-containing protein [Microbacterium sp. Kw_RZR3]|uniref:PepSY-associated TM helix domain-containing protein n=1 Tax=Microbacterium sp. Kw_RZR3 TaxID=3032903 RepID=UPI0023DC3CBB|nr:PepSY-associated TM helix domain-containing protein [Microbacterium sp. Kw_RZR3]MDF2047847.1 PepSY-associated TM helix domain-containing protein [Microbacterium sp. Kw_RZR3]